MQMIIRKLRIFLDYYYVLRKTYVVVCMYNEIKQRRVATQIHIIAVLAALHTEATKETNAP